jgi:hypothetical protein
METGQLTACLRPRDELVDCWIWQTEKKSIGLESAPAAGTVVAHFRPTDIGTSVPGQLPIRYTNQGF